MLLIIKSVFLSRGVLSCSIYYMTKCLLLKPRCATFTRGHERSSHLWIWKLAAWNLSLNSTWASNGICAYQVIGTHAFKTLYASNRDGAGTFSSFVDVIVSPYVILSEPDGLKWSGLIFLWLSSISSAPQQKAERLQHCKTWILNT